MLPNVDNPADPSTSHKWIIQLIPQLLMNLLDNNFKCTIGFDILDGHAHVFPLDDHLGSWLWKHNCFNHHGRITEINPLCLGYVFSMFGVAFCAFCWGGCLPSVLGMFTSAWPSPRAFPLCRNTVGAGCLHPIWKAKSAPRTQPLQHPPTSRVVLHLSRLPLRYESPGEAGNSGVIRYGVFMCPTFVKIYISIQKVQTLSR